MTTEAILTIGRQTLTVAATVSAPLLLTGLVVGIAVSVIQTITSVHEQTLTFIPKIAAVLLMLVFLSPWIVKNVCFFTVGLLNNLALLAR